LTDKFRFIFYLYLDAVLLKYKSSGLHIVTKTISTWLRNNISSKEKNNEKQNKEKDNEENDEQNDKEYSNN